MKIDNKAQLLSFIKTFGDDIYSAEELKLVEQVIDIDRIQTFSKKMLLLQWYFYQEITAENYESDSQMYQNALDRDLKNGLIHRFSVESNIGYFKDDWGKDSARTEMLKLAKDRFLIRKDIKNYIITPLGKECAKFIYFKILEDLIGIQKLWKLMKLDLTRDNLQNIDPKITIEDLENWFIVIKAEDKFTFHPKFEELIEFIKNHPELYPKDFQIIKENLISWITNSLISEFDKKHVRFTTSGNNLHEFKDKLDKIDWIYKIKCHYKRKEINLFNWATRDNYKFTSSSKEEDLNTFLNHFCVLMAPAGYGKSVLLNQLSLELLTTQNMEQYNVIPLYLSLKRLEVRDGKIFYDDNEIYDVESLSKKQNDFPAVESFITKLIGASLSIYNTNEFMLKIFFSVLNQTRVLLILDGWDELTDALRLSLSNILRSLINLSDLINNLKILIASRYTETHLNSIISKNIDHQKHQKIAITLKLPKEEEIYNYLALVSAKIKTKEDISELKAKFHGSLTPMDLFLLGIFPQVELPKFKTQLYNRWIYYQILTDVISPEEFNKIQSDEDIKVKLESIKISRELDDKTFYLSQLIGGNIKGNADINYSLLEILPRIAYSVFHPNIVKPIGYLDGIMSNPLLKRFISPYYQEFQRYTKLIDPHYYPYLIAKYIFTQFLEDISVEPIPYSEVEEFLIDLFKQHLNNPKIKELGISKPEHFPYYLYLQSGIILPALQLPYSGVGISSVPLSWISLRYGIFLLKAFQSEFRKGIFNKDSFRKTKILNLFEKFEKRRPTKTIGSYMDEYSKDTEIGEPIVNYTPLDYFNTIVELLDLKMYTKKSGVEIKYLNIKPEYFMQRSLDFYRGFHFAEADNLFYWKKEDLSIILKKIFESDNIYLMPWYARIFPYFKNESGFTVELNDEIILDKYKTSEDSYIKDSLLKILIINNPSRVLVESDLFLSILNNSNNLELLIYNLIEHWAENAILSKVQFQIWLKYFQHPSNTAKLKYILIRYLYNINLKADQVASLWALSVNEYKLNSQIELEDYYYSVEENPEELPFILNCLILLNYNKGIKKPDYYYNDVLIEREFLFKYVFTKRRFFYIKLLIDSEYISKENLSTIIKRMGFSYIFSYSHEVFQNLWYDRPYFQKRNMFLGDTHRFLLQVQSEWWNEHKPTKYAQLKTLLVGIFKFYKENEEKWIHETNLGSSFIRHEKEEIQPEIIQIVTLLDFIDNQSPKFEMEFVQDFFGLVEEYFLIKIEKDERDDYYFRYKPEIPLFIWLAFGRLKKIDSATRKTWIKRLLKIKIDFKEYKDLLSDDEDYSDLYDEIWEGTGKRWIGDKRFANYTRTSLHKKKPEIDDEFVYQLPFETLIEKIKQELNFKDYNFYKKANEELKEKDWIGEKGEEFLNAFFIIVDKLTELAQIIKYSDKSRVYFQTLWDAYYPLWTKIYNYHPHSPFTNMAFVLEEIYNTMTNDTDFTSKKEKIIDMEKIERQPQKKQSNIISHQEIEKLLKGRSLVSQNTKEILECVIPNYYINSWNEDEFLIPKDDRKYQKDIFWFLISLQYRKLNLGEVNLEMGYYKNNHNPMPYLKRLILDGIQENAINGWYKIKPKNIPYEWIKKNIDPLIIEHVFFPNQVEFIPEHLRLYGKLHAWKFIILPDLVNKVEQYFGANREDFPFTEYEKSYLTEDDDFSGFYSGIS